MEHTSFEHSLPANEISEFYLAEASRHCGFSIEHAPTILLFFPIVLLASEQSAAKEITPHSSTLPSEPRNPVSCLVPLLATPHHHSLVLITSPLFPLLRLFVPHNWRNYEYCLPDSFVLTVSISLPGLWWTDDSVLFRCTRRLCSILRDCSSLSSSAISLLVVSRERIFHLLVGRVLFCREGNTLCVVRTLFFHASLLLEDRSHPQTHISIHGEKSDCFAFDTGKHWSTQI